jgi:serine/threonine protein kinase
MQIYKNILRGEVEFPSYLSSDLIDLITKLLEVRAANRYGCLKNGTKDIKSHRWYSSIDWVAINEKRLEAPFIPKDDEDYYEQYDEKPLTSVSTALYSTEFDSF